MSIREQERAYQRGVVLGLTLAELVLIVIFCLLLLFAFAQKLTSDPQRTAARDRNLELAEPIINEMNDLRKEKPLDEFWRELRQAHENLPRFKDQAEKALADKQAAAADAARARQEAKRAQDDLNRERKGQLDNKGHKWPPFIKLSESEGYRFARGDATLSKTFEDNLRSEVSTILKYIADYPVNVIEIVGHTDELPIQGRASNLDVNLLRFLHDNGGDITLMAADNAGLGMARAAAVARFLRSDPRLAKYRNKIFALSSAQILDTNESLADGSNPGDVPERRRIEIRLRQSESR